MLNKEQAEKVFNDYLRAGFIKYEDRDFIGLSGDGIWVSLGMEARDVINYLKYNPSRENW